MIGDWAKHRSQITAWRFVSPLKKAVENLPTCSVCVVLENVHPADRALNS